MTRDELVVGYARVSRLIPGDIAGQVQALEAAGAHAEHIWTDSGLSGRPHPAKGRQQALQALTAAGGGTLVITDWPRLASSQGDLLRVLDVVTSIRSMTIATSKASFTADELEQLRTSLEIVVLFDAQQLQLRFAERRRRPAKKDRRGSNYRLTEHEEDRVADLYAGGAIPPQTLAAIFGLSKATLYRIATPSGTTSSRDPKPW